jgi:hypothetical protein
MKQSYLSQNGIDHAFDRVPRALLIVIASEQPYRQPSFDLSLDDARLEGSLAAAVRAVLRSPAPSRPAEAPTTMLAAQARGFAFVDHLYFVTYYVT